MARGDHRGTMMFASSLCTDSVEEAEQILAYFNNVRAYIASIEAPVYPFAIDAELAAEGEAVFAGNCAGCHGSYGATDEEDTYPNLIFEADFVGTDPLVASFANESPLPQTAWRRSGNAAGNSRMGGNSSKGVTPGAKPSAPTSMSRSTKRRQATSVRASSRALPAVPKFTTRGRCPPSRAHAASRRVSAMAALTLPTPV